MSQYSIELHKDAKQTLNSMREHDRARVTDVLVDVAQTRKPTDHSKCKVLSNNQKDNIYKIRVGDFRLLAQLQKPKLKVLKLGRRQGFYDDTDEIYASL